MEREKRIRERVHRAFCAPREQFSTNDEVNGTSRNETFLLPFFSFLSREREREREREIGGTKSLLFCLLQWNDYLEQREDVAFNMVEGIDLEETEARLKKVEQENAHLIAASQAKEV